VEENKQIIDHVKKLSEENARQIFDRRMRVKGNAAIQ